MVKLALLRKGCIQEQCLESHLIDQLKENNIERAHNLEESDYILYITCAGVGDTIHKCIKELYDLKYYKKKESKLIITGCLTEFDSLLEDFKKDDTIKIIKNKDWIVPVMNYIQDENKRNTNQIKLENRTRNFANSDTSIQFFLESGCVNQCSFCKKNYASMKVKSVPYQLALDYLRKKIQNGTRVILLSGDNLTLYGIDLYQKQMLHQFIHELSMEPNLLMIKVGEITATNIYPELLEELINNPKVVSVDVQIQTASNSLLKLMNRGSMIEENDEIIRRLREHHKVVNTVLMSGFPTETYEDLDITLKYIKDRQMIVDSSCEYVDFEYIPSSKLEQLSKKEKKLHTKYLQEQVKVHNLNTYANYLPYLRNIVLVGTMNGYHVFDSEILCWGISKNKKYEELPLGTVISDKPKKMIYKSSFNKGTVYKL